MSTSTLAIPSALPGGLEAGMGMHFGHCDIYTIVQIEVFTERRSAMCGDLS